MAQSCIANTNGMCYNTIAEEENPLIRKKNNTRIIGSLFQSPLTEKTLSVPNQSVSGTDDGTHLLPPENHCQRQ